MKPCNVTADPGLVAVLILIYMPFKLGKAVVPLTLIIFPVSTVHVGVPANPNT